MGVSPLGEDLPSTAILIHPLRYYCSQRRQLRLRRGADRPGRAGGVEGYPELPAPHLYCYEGRYPYKYSYTAPPDIVAASAGAVGYDYGAVPG